MLSRELEQALSERTYNVRKKGKLGSGERFDTLKRSIAAKGGVDDPAAVAAAIGRKKYSKERFQKMAAAGKK